MAATSQYKKKFNDYEGFVEKFKPKKTTDDCYTPDNIYNVVLQWASSKYGFDKKEVLRPFWPDADYRTIEYPEWCVVVDNPPFSILTEIIKFYNEKGIKYFMFAPALTCPVHHATGIMCSESITYQNGAVVNTAFVTNMAGDILMSTEPELKKMIADVNKLNEQKNNCKNINILHALSHQHYCVKLQMLNLNFIEMSA